MSDTPPTKLAVILHADGVGSTALVRLDETLAQQRMAANAVRFSQEIEMTLVPTQTQHTQLDDRYEQG